ncbi:ATPase [Candidatus Saganbacteria bacterium CG08_land_8_20_14_0_20_45_16]|uniref:ATPase n=1 Tax=Candidatus Saganbacteria bacterium CG08_land_8_20_14_0_20_45_16 TaxID=2014293 RepID=A0A2H0XUQ4_UNCSA|nr:MAG: ATPase [Candidatus Saganbacteria bacterium CG08_land_8_20_14_0_20_45_16]
MNEEIKAIDEKVKTASGFVTKLERALAETVVGQKTIIDKLIIALLCNGHVLIEGLPGLAKTLIIKSLSNAISAQFSRIQFTPDLLPSDLIGTMILNPRTGEFSERQGPIFANLILADEINRAPSKVQSALLEAMQEHQVTIGGKTHKLPQPFMVMATQNPIEQEGTYPLPEAAIDRFIFKLKITYPLKEEELKIIDQALIAKEPVPKQVATIEEIISTRQIINQIYIDEKLKHYIINLINATRKPEEYGLNEIRGLIQYGASPRASIYLAQTAKGHAFTRRRGYVTPDDIKSIGLDVLRHRLILTYEAEAEEQTTETIIQKIFDAVQVP